jgi:hypothetical protein
MPSVLTASVLRAFRSLEPQTGRSPDYERTDVIHLRCRVGHLLFVLLLVAQYAQPQTNPKFAGPLSASGNPHYFQDVNGTPLILNGSQSWNTLQDFGSEGTPQGLDFDAFVKFLTRHGHNFTLLWAVEMPKFCNHHNTVGPPPAYTVRPLPWERTGPGMATDGGLKFDLTKFDQNFFSRLRVRTQALNDAGIYAGVYLFTGEYLLNIVAPATVTR